MRAMPLAFPGDRARRATTRRSSCAATRCSSRRSSAAGGEVEVALPPGAWYDLNSRAALCRAERVLRYKAALDQFPVFGREGYALPLGRAVQHTGEIDLERPLEQLWVFGKPDALARRFRARPRSTPPRRRFAIHARRRLAIERFGTRPTSPCCRSKRRNARRIPRSRSPPASPPGSARSSSRARGASSRATVPGAARRLRRSRSARRARAADRPRAGVRSHSMPRRPARPLDAIEIWHQPVAAPVDAGPPRSRQRGVRHRDAHARRDACATGAFARSSRRRCRRACCMDAGSAFSGHTEFFAERTHTPRVVMLLVGGGLRVALVTTHLAARRRAGRDHARGGRPRRSRSSRRSSRATSRIAPPRIAVCGLNPACRRRRPSRPRGDRRHRAGDRRGARRGPRRHRARCRPTRCSCPTSRAASTRSSRCIHDQGLPVLKAASFGHGVNVTLGLPFIRTSVDHGTALDLAVDGRRRAAADPGSLFAAVDLAIELAARRRAEPARCAATPRRKRFGQNFLVDPHYVARIVDADRPQPGDNLVEIGPGLAALTRAADRAARATFTRSRSTAISPRGSPRISPANS